MRIFLTALALVVGMSGMVAAEEPIDEPIRDTGDVFRDFWSNLIKHPFRDWGTGETTWDQMMRSVELGGYLRVRYETTEVRSIQRIFGPSPTGPIPNLRMVGDSWANWIAYKAMFTTTFTLTDDITFHGSLINMNVIGNSARFRRTIPGGAPLTRLKSPQIHDPEVALYEGYMQWDNFMFPGITAKTGRQELVYGDQWLLSNNSFYGGLTWDSAKLSISAPGLDGELPLYTVDFFIGQVNSMYTIPGPARPRIYGVYASCYPNTGMNEGRPTELDLYLLHNTDNMGTGNIGLRTDFARDKRYTVGSRLAGDLLPDIDYSLQGAYQFGRTGWTGGTTSRVDVRAYAAQAEIGKTWSEMDWTPRVALRAAYASGDGNPADNKNEAFNPLYQDPHGMHGFADALHFTNLIDYAVTVTMHPDENWTLGAEGHAFELAERPAGPRISKEVGQEFDLYAKLKAADNLSVTLVWGVFAQGEAFRNATGARDHDQRLYFNVEYGF